MTGDMQAVTVDTGVEEKAETVTFSAMKAVVEVDGKNAESAVEFYKKAFGAEEVKRTECRKRKNDQENPLLVSAELKIGSEIFLVMDSENELVNGSRAVLCLETDNVNAAISKAVECGATKEGEINEDEAGGIYAKVKDPFGSVWIIASTASKKNCTPAKSEAEPEPEPLNGTPATTEAPAAA